MNTNKHKQSAKVRKMKKNSKDKLPILIVAILIIVGVITMFFGGYIKNPSLLKNASDVWLKNRPSPTTNPTENWKTYRNSVLQYSLRYPRDWKLYESMSMGYPYITLADPVVQEQAERGDTHISQGASIYISAEEFRAVVPLNDYIKNFAGADRDEQGNWMEITHEETVSNVWGLPGPHLSSRSGNVLQHIHAAMINYPETSLQVTIHLTIFNVKSDQTDKYLATFDQILSSLTFTPPATFPLPDFATNP